MKLIDTHTHLYLDAFDEDRDAMIQRAIEAGIDILLLPNIDQESIKPMMELCEKFPSNCFPMIGLHPTSVASDYQQQLQRMEEQIHKSRPVAIGEIGIDLYWDKSFKEAQIDAFNIQLEWAKIHQLPVAIHTREAFPLMLDLVKKAQDGRLTGVFHCFTGTSTEAKRILDLGFYMGIGGVLTYKKSELPELVKNLPLTSLLLETDAPFLPPVPYRGKRNESAYLIEVVKKMATIRSESIEEIAWITSSNARKLFNIA